MHKVRHPLPVMQRRHSVRRGWCLLVLLAGWTVGASVQATIPPPVPPPPVTNPRPTPPNVTVNAGVDQTVNGGSTVTLSGTSSASGATWSQTAGSTVTLSSTSSASPAFRAPRATSSQQTLTFRYSASRNWSWCRRWAPIGGACVDRVRETVSASDTVSIKVRARASVPPLSANAGSNKTVSSGSSVTLSGSATGGSGTKSYAWTQTGGSPTVTISNANRASASFMAPTVTARRTLTFKLTVTAGGRTSTDTMIVSVTAAQSGSESPTVSGTVSGTLTGALSVDQTGSAGYTIPIEVPPGTAGMQPSLSLSYNSNGGNGILGQGWTLQGLSTISRCPKTKAQDNAYGTIRYNADDRFCLDGQRLVAVRGSDGSSGTEYRTEIDSFVKVISRGTAGSGPQYWEVWTKSGQKMEYGRTTTSRVEATGQTSVRQWKLNRVEDTVGNYLTVSYTEDTADGFVYPSRIDYSGHKQGSVTRSPYASVRFSYGERHDDIVLMQGGYKVGVDQRLINVKTYVGATLVSDYRLAYSTTGLPYPSRITNIQHCDGAGGCLPGVSLTWKDLGVGSVVSAESMSRVNSRFENHVLTGDFDGDGRDSTISASVPSGYTGYSPLVGDYDGDGDVEVAWTKASRSGLYFYLDGSARTVGSGNYDGYIAQTGDFDGDSRSDIVWTKAHNGGVSARAVLDSSLVVLTNTRSTTGSSKKSSVPSRQCSNCIPSPRVNAGSNQEVVNGSLVRLSGNVTSGSSVSWSQSSGPRVTLSSTTSTSPSFTAPNVIGPMDLVFRLSATRYGISASDSVTITVLTSPPVPPSLPSGDYRGYEAQVGDFNGDGLSDLVWSKAYNGGIKAYVTLGNGSGGFGSAVSKSVKTGSNYTGYQAQVADLNGDGLSDMVWMKGLNRGLRAYAVLSEGDGSFASVRESNPLRSGNRESYEPLMGDFSGDGVMDLAWAEESSSSRNVYISLGDGTGLFRTARYNSVSSLSSEQGGGYRSFSVDHTQATTADYNGDGIPEIVWRSWVTTREAVTFTYSGTPLQCMDHGYSYPCEIQGSGTRTSRFWANHYARGVAPADYGRVSSIASGNGTTFRLDYELLTASGSDIYTKDSGADLCSLPCRDVQAPVHVVKEITKDHGSSLMERITYQYGGAKADLAGRGFKGFRWMESRDARTGIISRTLYKQEFPHAGQIASSSRYVGSSTKTYLSTETNAWSSRSLNGGKTKFPYISSSTAKTYELEDGSRNSAVTTTTNSSVYDSYGNPTSITVTTTGAGGTFRKVTTNTYTNTTSKWHLGRLACAKVRSEAPGETAVTRTSGFAYSSATGLLTKEVVEPGSGAVSGCVSALSASALGNITLTTSYLYDKYGNQRQATTSAAGVASRSSTTVWGERATDGTVTASGRFPVSVSNALGHAAKNWYSKSFGKLLRSQDANGLETRWTYDGFGRPTQTVHPDGRQTTIRYRNCTDAGLSCPTRAVRAIVTNRTGSASVTSYLDRRGLVVRTKTEGFDGTAIYQDAEYDAAGQATRKSRAYHAGETTQWSRYTYDKLGRVKSETLPNGSLTTTNYDGLVGGRIRERRHVRMSAGATARTTTREYDALGRTVRMTDPSGNLTNFEYTESGEQKKVTAANSSVTTRTFDLRGRLLLETDPDRDTQTYAYNALGELVSQTNARGQTVLLKYDLLGRLVHRVEPEGTTVWVYDATLTSKGRLAQVSGSNGYLRTHAYDAYGRPSSETVTIGGERFTNSRTYDSAGRVSTVTYPTSGLVVRHEYTATGYLKKVRKNASCGTVYWTASEVNAEGQVEESLLGNGVGTTRVYDPRTGLVRSIQSGLEETSAVQDLGYVFNAYGNLTSREDFAQDVRESFTYDRLNRLTGSTLKNAETEVVLSSKSYRYDAVGNITNKSDVGAVDYVYGVGSAGPHAVTSAGGHTYAYDASGNMVSGAGRTLTWTSFQKPRTVAKGSTTSTFEYGPDRKRTRQVKVKGSVTETVTYVGGMYEQVKKTGVATEHVHYIFAGGMRIAVETASEAINSSAKLRYLHQDHLGSVDVVTNESGTVVERLSFGAFGERRVALGTTTWQDSALALSSSETRRGFTDHEQLDDFGLVHMNGRVYDPALGRFLSADPFVQFALSSQGYNRYTYANNNPLSFTDPNGYFVKSLFRSIKKLVKKALGNKVVRIVASVAFAAYGGPAGASLLGFAENAIVEGLVGGFGAGLISSGGDFKVALVSGFTGAGFGWAGGSGLSSVNRVVAHGVVGGVGSELSGGKFGDGFASAAFVSVVAPKVDSAVKNETISRVVAIAAVAGTASALGGGKFANGAAMAAFAYLSAEALEFAKQRTDALYWKACSATADRICVQDARGVYRTDGTRGTQGSRNWISDSGMAQEGSGDHWYDQGGWLDSELVRHFITDVSKIHDYMNSWNYDPNTGLYIGGRGLAFDAGFQVYSVSGMLPAALLTLSAKVGQVPLERQLLAYQISGWP